MALQAPAPPILGDEHVVVLVPAPLEVVRLHGVEVPDARLEVVEHALLDGGRREGRGVSAETALALTLGQVAARGNREAERVPALAVGLHVIDLESDPRALETLGHDSHGGGAELVRHGGRRRHDAGRDRCGDRC